jgi:hypothetical protein
MLNRVALDRDKNYADVVADFVPDVDTSWPDLIEISARASSIRVRLGLHMTRSISSRRDDCPLSVKT